MLIVGASTCSVVFSGHMPDEMYFGTAVSLSRARGSAQSSRLAANRA
jgi:hypothetical protein